MLSLLAVALVGGGGRGGGGAEGNEPGVAHRVRTARDGLGDVRVGGDCVSPAQRLEGLNAIAAWRLGAGGEDSFTARTLPRVPFVPMGATLYEDLLPPGYVDLDPSTGFRDYSCHLFTYDGHLGTDMGLRSFAEQDVGVPVFAALDGVVVYAHDGEPDHSACLCGTPANALILDHGDGLYAWYWHFRTGTVAAAVGEHVVAGQTLGLAGSSGNSAGPHLHLGFADAVGERYDAFAGDCGGDGLWTRQPAMDLRTYIADFGFSTQNLSGLPYYPYAFPNTGQMGTDEFLWFWAQIVNLPPHSSWRQKYIQPDGVVAFDSGETLFESDQTEFYRVGHWWWYTYYVWQMREITGTWRVQLLINGRAAIDAPVVVHAPGQPVANRPPSAVSVAFDPPEPRPGEVVFARVSAPLALDDPDYDRVRYRYVWRVDGQVVRDVTYAGRADALPRTALATGGRLSCTVTPSDGVLSGPQASVSASLCAADFNGDGFLDFFDYDDYVFCFETGTCPPGRDADFNGDQFADFFDYDDYVAAFESGC